jgi:hypothetical protein
MREQRDGRTAAAAPRQFITMNSNIAGCFDEGNGAFERKVNATTRSRQIRDEAVRANDVSLLFRALFLSDAIRVHPVICSVGIA